MNYTLYAWLALDAQQQLQKGLSLAEHKEQALTQLHAQGLAPLKLQQQYHFRSLTWKNTDRIRYIEQLATLLHAGLPLAKCLTLLAEDHPLRHWQCLLQRLASQINNGIPLSEAMMDYSSIFPPSMERPLRPQNSQEGWMKAVWHYLNSKSARSSSKLKLSKRYAIPHYC